MNIMNQEENYVVKYNIDMDSIIDEYWEKRIERKDQSPVKLKLDSPIIVRGSTRKK